MRNLGEQVEVVSKLCRRVCPRLELPVVLGLGQTQLRCMAVLILIPTVFLGCSPSESRTVTNDDGSVSTVELYSDEDVIDAAVPLGWECCELLIPFARAIEKRDYDAAYDAVDPMAFADVHTLQFVRESPRMEVGRGLSYDYVGDATDRIGKVDKEMFKQIMLKEEAVGIPLRLSDVIQEFVFEGEPPSPQAGRYPEGYPFEKVVGSVSIILDCEMNDATREALAKRYDCDPTELRDGFYMKIFAMVAEIDGELKVIYLDFYEMRMEE